jgi:putative transposase
VLNDPKPENETAGKLKAGAGRGPLDESRGRQRRPRKGHSEEQIVYAIRQVEAGKKVTDVCREMGVSAQAFYSWKRRYAGVGVSELRELRQLRDENRQLKTLVADLTLDKHILQEVLSKKV